MNIIVFGTGSIGKRHCRNIKQIEPAANLYFFRQTAEEDDFSREMNAKIISNLSEIDNTFDVALVCCPTGVRDNIYERLISRNIPMFVEKPVVSSLKQLFFLEQALYRENYTARTLVGFNLRFLPIVKKVKAIVDSKILGNVCRAHFDVGQYLPEWRPTIDYRETYSAHTDLGGGALLDLSHEVDLAHYIFGSFETSYVAKNKLSSLEINSEDTACVLLYKKNAPIITIGMDYVARKKIRQFRIIGEEATLFCDLMNKNATIEPHKEQNAIHFLEEDFCVGNTYFAAMETFIFSLKNKKEEILSLEKSLPMHKLLFNTV